MIATSVQSVPTQWERVDRALSRVSDPPEGAIVSTNFGELARELKRACVAAPEIDGNRVSIRLDAALPPTVMAAPTALVETLRHCLQAWQVLTPTGVVRLDMLAEQTTEEQATLRFRFGSDVPPSDAVLPLPDGWELNRRGGAQTSVVLTFSVRPDRPMPDAPPTTDAPGALAGIRLLLVEDDEINRRVAAKYLEHWQIEVTYATDGQEAIDRLGERPYDIVLMDLQMPGVDGYEATRRIRALGQPWCADVPIVAVTAALAPEGRNQCLRDGMTDYLTKPFQPNALRRMIGQYCNRASNSSGHPVRTVTPEPTVPSPKEEVPLLDFSHITALDDSADFQLHMRKLCRKLFARIRTEYPVLLQAHDAKQLGHLAHEARATLQLLGLQQLDQAMRRGRALASNATTDGLSESVSEVVDLCVRVEEELAS